MADCADTKHGGPRDPVNDAIVALLDRVNTRHADAISAVEQEIKRNGQRWAAREIWLSRQRRGVRP